MSGVCKKLKMRVLRLWRVFTALKGTKLAGVITKGTEW